MRRSTHTLEERVAAGIVLLDEFGPADWRERIDLETLSFPGQTTCVLGQLYGQFVLGLTELRTNQNLMFSSTECGFLSDGEPYAALTHEWKRQLGATS